MNIKKLFQAASYLQYPLMLLALFFAAKPYFNGLEYLAHHLDMVITNFNYVLIFAGLGISFSTLQDTTKTQNNFSKKIWENPKKGKVTIIIISCMTLFILAFGVLGFFISSNEKIQELSIGGIVLGIGFIGFLKSAIEVYENHRTDKK